MQASGMIIAALDTTPAAIEDWNVWYDLDHLPPNVGLPGIMSGRRYVATPELNALRIGEEGSWWKDQESTFLTIYTLCGDIPTTFGAMVTLRDQLDESGRMFAEDLKAVRGGDGLDLQRATGRSGLTNDPSELPFLGHTGLLVLRNRQGGEYLDADHDALAAAALSDDRGGALLSYASAVVPGAGLHIVLVEGDVAAAAKLAGDALGEEQRFSLAAYSVITPLTYPWADDLRAAGLPQMPAV